MSMLANNSVLSNLRLLMILKKIGFSDPSVLNTGFNESLLNFLAGVWPLVSMKSAVSCELVLEVVGLIIRLFYSCCLMVRTVTL